MKKAAGSLLALLLTLFVSGCLLIPAMESFRETGINESDRQRLLSETVKKFHDSLYWSSPMDALKYVKDESRKTVSKDLQRMVEGRRIIESKIKNVDYADGSWEADVTMTIRSFKIPVYVVQDRTERELWTFSLSDGWMLKEILPNDGQGKY